MVRAIDILKRSDIRNVLGLLTGGVSDRRFEKMVQRYYTLYCLLLESLLSDDPLEIAVTDYRQERSESAKSDFYFYGKPSGCIWNKEPEKRLNLRDIFMSGDLLLFPECFADSICDEWISAEILLQMENDLEPDMLMRMDQKLFLNVRETGKGTWAKRRAVRRTMERIIHDQTGELWKMLLQSIWKAGDWSSNGETF